MKHYFCFKEIFFLVSKNFCLFFHSKFGFILVFFFDETIFCFLVYSQNHSYFAMFHLSFFFLINTMIILKKNKKKKKPQKQKQYHFIQIQQVLVVILDQSYLREGINQSWITRNIIIVDNNNCIGIIIFFFLCVFFFDLFFCLFSFFLFCLCTGNNRTTSNDYINRITINWCICCTWWSNTLWINPTLLCN